MSKQPTKLTIFLNLEINHSHPGAWDFLYTKSQTKAYFGILMVELQPIEIDYLCAVRTAAQELQWNCLKKSNVYLSLTRKSEAQ